MTSITRNLPWFIRDLGVSIVGQKCYTSLIENLDISDVQCIKYSVSKGLGIGIVAGGSIMKVPQVLLIVNAHSAEGLSLTGYTLETLSYAITLVYSFRHNFPFSTYGENFFLTIQNALITLLIISYSPTPSKSVSLATASLFGLAAAGLFSALPQQTLALLQIATLPLSLSAKLPQILQNARAKSTGQLSTIAVVAQILGCLARLFTTATEVGDRLVAAGFALALLFNLVLGAQMWMFWGNPGVQNASKTNGASAPEPVARAAVVAPVQEAKETKTKVEEKIFAYNEDLAARRPSSPQPVLRRMATPPPGSPSGRKWARKID